MTPGRKALRAIVGAGVATGALAAGSALAVLPVAASPAAPPGRPNLVITQAATAGAERGHTEITVRIRNIGHATAAQINVQTYIRTSSTTFTTACPSRRQRGSRVHLDGDGRAVRGRRESQEQHQHDPQPFRARREMT